MVEVVNDRTESYLRALRELINPRLQIVVVVFPTSRDDRYSAVKKLCCIESPIPSQVSTTSYKLYRIWETCKSIFYFIIVIHGGWGVVVKIH